MNRAKLYWQCRRGMLELDLLLQGFLERGYDQLTPAQSRAFETLLSYPDPTLLEYLMGRMVPVDGTVADVVRQIRSSAAA